MTEADKTIIHNINHQVTSYLFERARPEIIIGLISALIAAWYFRELINQSTLFYWTGCAAFIYVLRLLISGTGIINEVSGTRSFLFLLTLIACGILWGAAGYFTILHESIILKTTILTLIVCLCFFITMIYSGKISYFLAFTIPALGLTVYPMLDQSSGLLYALLATGSFLFLVSLIYHNSFLSGLRLRAEYDQLREQHDSLTEQSKKTEVSLKSALQRNDEIQENLSQASVDLNHCETRKESLVTTLQSNIKTDPITNLSNRKDFLETVQQEWQRAARSKDPLTIAYINVDGFDTLSKEKDKKTVLSTLKKIGASIKQHGRRAGDLPARIDKAGFALLLLGADSTNASKIIDNVRKSVSSLNLPANSKNDPVTVHAGVATLIPNSETSPEEIFGHAESAAYEAEFQGGDRVVSFHAFHDIEISQWDTVKDGDLNEANFQQKLLSHGYNTKREIIPPKTSFNNQSFKKAALFAVFSGHFLLNIEGQNYELKRGSSLILPEGISFSAEVVGDMPVILYLEKR